MYFQYLKKNKIKTHSLFLKFNNFSIFGYGTATVRLRYGMFCYGTVRYGTLRYGTLRYVAVRYATVYGSFSKKLL